MSPKRQESLNKFVDLGIMRKCTPLTINSIQSFRKSCLALVLTITLTPGVFAQSKKIIFVRKGFQLSFVPGVSTNGLQGGMYFNKFSINILSGLSAGNTVFEVGTISNGSIFGSSGIQVAGIANITGINNVLSEPDERQLSRKELQFTPSFHGIQVAGLLNYVSADTKGLQFSGMFNSTAKELRGVQVAGLGNMAGGTTAGFQLAGLYNLSGETMTGIQISALFNLVDGRFAGTQIGFINKAHDTSGKNSTPPTRARGLQLGVVNLNKEMDGLQFGLFNFGGSCRGVQIGLVNFFEKYPTKENVKLGIPIGLINFGSRGPHYKVSNSEMFPVTIEYSTGQCRNCSPAQSEMPYNGKNQVYFHNSIIVSAKPGFDIWAAGYGFQRLLFNKVAMAATPQNGKRLLAQGVKFRYLYRTQGSNSFNLLSSLNFDYGKRVGPGHLYGSITLNFFICKEDLSVYHLPSWSAKMGSGSEGIGRAFWPGYSIGFTF